MDSRAGRAALPALAALALSAAGCGAAPPQPAFQPTAPVVYLVRGLADGDTAFISPALAGATSVRLVNIDAPELRGDTQEPWASQARDRLRALLPNGTRVTIATDRDTLDVYGRVLGRVISAEGGVDANQEQLRQGMAVLYVLWPNTAHFEEYRAAQQEAQRARRGVWGADGGLRELPFEYRRRLDHARLSRPAGDYITGFYVAAADYAQVDVNNRVFFASEGEAQAAGFRPCPRTPSGYAHACFATGSE